MENHEIEVKFPLDENIKSKIQNLQFELHNEIDEYFFTEETSRTRDRWLRLRQKHGKYFYELKEKVKTRLFQDNTSVMDEFSCEISPEQYKTIKISFEKVFPIKIVVKKERSVAKINGCDLTYDRVESLGDFIEVEGPKENIDRICSDFGIDATKMLLIGYPEMMLNKIYNK